MLKPTAKLTSSNDGLPRGMLLLGGGKFIAGGGPENCGGPPKSPGLYIEFAASAKGSV